MIGSLALGLARNPAPEHRWRRVAVPVAAAIALLLALTAASLIQMELRQADRARQRTALVAATPAATDVFALGTYDQWRERQIALVWIEPAGDGEPVLPPGVTRLPAPGQAVVSPALDRLARQEPEVALRYPDHLVLGLEGVRTGGELFAYIRTPTGRTIAGHFATQRASAFGPPAGGNLGTPLGIPSTVNVHHVVQGTVGFLVLPGLLVLAVGTVAASTVRDHRFAVLGALGVPQRSLLALAVLETALLALPGMVVATAAWGVIAPRLARVPLVGHDIVRGDLGLSWWKVALLLGGGMIAVGLTALLVAAVTPGAGKSRLRPILGRGALSPVRVVPLLVVVGMLAVGAASIRTSSGPWLVLTGVVLSVAAVPLLFPGVVRAVGALLGDLGPVPALLAGRALQWDPIRTTRPFAAFGMLVLMTLAWSGLAEILGSNEEPDWPETGTQTATVHWVDPQPGDPARLAAALGSGLVAPIAVDDGDPQSDDPARGAGAAGSGPVTESRPVNPIGDDGGALTIGTTCQQLARYLPDAVCRPEAPFELPPTMADALAPFARAGGQPIRLVPPETLQGEASAMVLDKERVDILHERVHTAALRTLVAPSVISWASFVKRTTTGNAWLINGGGVALVALTIGSVLAIVDRLLATRRIRGHLLTLGLTPSRLRGLEIWLFAAPYATVFAVSFSAGLAICWLFVRLQHLPMPWDSIVGVVGLSLLVGVLGAASVAVFGALTTDENPAASR